MITAIATVLVLTWCFFGYVAARACIYEKIFYYNNHIMVSDWIVGVFKVLAGPLALFSCVGIESENMRRGFFLSPVKKTKEARQHEHILIKTMLGKFFAIKEK